MAYPPEITLRPVTIGGANILESGEQLSLVAEITSSRGLMWGSTGWQFHAVTRTVQGNDGAELSFSLPVTDLAGWRLLDNPGAAIDVTIPGSYTHTYTIRLTTMQGRHAVAVRTVGPFVLPAEDLSPVDLDLMLPVGTQAGGVALVPGAWDAKVAAAEAAATSVASTLTTEDAAVASFVSDTASATRNALGNMGRRFAIFGDSWTTPIDGVSIPNNAVAAVGGTIVANHGVAGAIIGPSSQNGGNATDAQAAAAAADTSYNKTLITDVLVIAGVNNIGSYLPNVAEIRDHFAAIGSLYPKARLWYVANSKRTLTYDSDPWRWYHRFFEGASLAGFAVAQLSPLWNLGTLRGQPSATLATDYWDWTNPSGLGSRHMTASGQTAWVSRLAGFLSGNPWRPECKVGVSLHPNAAALIASAGVAGTPAISTDDTYLDGNVLRLNVSVAGMENLTAVASASLQPVLQLPEGYWPSGNYMRRAGMLSRLSGGTMASYVLEVTPAGVVQVDGRGLNDHAGYFLINAEVALNTPKLA